jgi:16S rRNA (guanine966-N2)-methyltransferase
VRIIAGQFRSVALAHVGKGDTGAHLRPTTDRVRESLFNVLAHQGVIDGARVLDLFAGTGAMGLEALSRGALWATFVDDGRVAQGLIAQNIRKLGVQARARVLRTGATRLPPCDGPPFDLVFLDPPYGKGLGDLAVASLVKGGWLAGRATLVWEENSPVTPPGGFVLSDRRKYGDSHITLLSAESD